MQAVLEQNRIAAAAIDRTRSLFGEQIGIFGSLFGCWHKRLTRPITSRSVTYRACIDCGARKAFDPQEFHTTGPFYYPPSIINEPA